MTTKKIVKTKRIPVNQKSSRTESVSNTIPLLLYRRIALLFVVLVASALGVVLYLATMQAVIRVTTVPKDVVADFIVQDEFFGIAEPSLFLSQPTRMATDFTKGFGTVTI